jgi:hypothetical protein
VDGEFWLFVKVNQLMEDDPLKPEDNATYKYSDSISQ